MCFLLDAPFFTSPVAPTPAPAPAPAPTTIVPGVVTTSAIGAATTVINTASVAPITVPGVVTQTASPIPATANPSATLTTTPQPTTTTLAPNCTTETTNNIYLISQDGFLYQFTPATIKFTFIGPINCSSTSTSYFIALQRNGILWVLVDDGGLYTYNIQTAQCTITAFVRNQTDLFQFTMAFVKNDNDAGEVLYISKDNGNGGVLATIDLNSLNVSKVGNYNDGSFADLGGTNDGKLFGFFADSSYIIKQINKTNAQILSQYPLPEPLLIGSNNYAFAPYGLKFFYFLGSGNSTDIHYFDTTTNISSLIETVPTLLYNAATSVCLDTSKPVPLPKTDCIPETINYIYFVDDQNLLYQFNPITFAVTGYAAINCSETSNVSSIALQRNGILWILFEDDDLYTFNLTDQSCVNTGFVHNQSDFSDFEMAFAKDSNGIGETLYLSKSNDGGGVLAFIDLVTLNIFPIGNYTDGSIANLVGSTDGGLYGFFLDGSLLIKKIDDTNAQIYFQYPIDEAFDGNPEHYSVASYGDQFVYFRSSQDRTYLHLFDTTTNTTSLINTVPYRILDAATSTCLDTSLPIIPPLTDCTVETEDYIYLVDLDNILYKFSPKTFQVTVVGPLNCSETSSVFSIALQRNGLLWVLFNDGDLYTFNVTDQTCINTGFGRNQTGILDFTMAFVKNVGDNKETLFISKLYNGGGVLAEIDTNTLSIVEIGNYSDGAQFATLTGSNDGRLFGLFFDNPPTIKEVDDTDAQILSEYPLNEPFDGFVYLYSFASYENKFFYFLNSENSTYIHLFDPKTNRSTLLNTVPFSFFNAATSTCLDTSAPIILPKTYCIPETEDYNYLVDDNNVLYKFSPITLDVTEVGPIVCSDSSHVSTIALAQNGILVVLFDDGKLYTFDIIDKSCFDTGFVQNQSDISYFSMAFVKNSSGIDETLFISKVNDGGGVLATIDASTLKITVIGNYDNGSIAGLTGSNNGRLFALFLDGPLKIKEIDDTNAQTLSEYPLDLPFDGRTTFYTFSSYGNKFFVFHADVNTTDIHLFDPQTEKSTLLKSIPYKIIDGATSVCFNEIESIPKPTTDCSPRAQKNTYAVDTNNNLYRLDPITFTLTNVSTIDCSVNEIIISIALQRSGLLWVHFTDGKLYKYNITTKTCTDSGFVRNQTDIQFFSMTFAKNDFDSDELLYISKINDDGGKLASIDLDTLTVSYIGNYTEGQFADIHETEIGRLFGVFVSVGNGILLTLRAIDPATAQILYEFPTQTAPFNTNSFSFLPFVSEFISMLCFDNTTYLSVTDPAKNTTIIKSTLPICLTSLAGSTCLGS